MRIVEAEVSYQTASPGPGVKAKGSSERGGGEVVVSAVSDIGVYVSLCVTQVGLHI